jgi:hypothetical protein
MKSVMLLLFMACVPSACNRSTIPTVPAAIPTQEEQSRYLVATT